MKVKKIIAAVAIAATVLSFASMGASAGTGTYNVDMTKSWTDCKREGGMLCNYYWPGSFFTGCSAQTRISVADDQSGYAYVYCRGQGQSVGNEKKTTIPKDHYITTERCYANGNIGYTTIHRFIRTDGKDGEYIYYPA
ncbi:MAG: hypothetical protein HFJ80_02535 [Clostridiales bacterium]|nr:hypothetical protein [Clostridiales bacterium]